jgi:hypothetical protein
MVFLQLLLILIPSSIIALLWGRRKHIGGWWSLILCATSIPFAMIPGIIAVISSPRATNKPTASNESKIVIGYILTGVGLFQSILGPYYLVEGYSRIGRINFAFGFSILVLGIYMLLLGNGKVVNKHPVVTDNVLLIAFRSLMSKLKSKKGRIDTIPSITYYEGKPDSWENTFYFLENDQVLGPFRVAELQSKGVKSDVMVCRNGDSEWLEANQYRELKPVIIFSPPPVPGKVDDPINNPEPKKDSVLTEPLIYDIVSDSADLHKTAQEEKIIIPTAYKESQPKPFTSDLMIAIHVILIFLIIMFCVFLLLQKEGPG